MDRAALETKLGAIRGKDIATIVAERVWIEALGGNEYSERELRAWLDEHAAAIETLLVQADVEVVESVVAAELTIAAEDEAVSEKLGRGENVKLSDLKTDDARAAYLTLLYYDMATK